MAACFFAADQGLEPAAEAALGAQVERMIRREAAWFPRPARSAPADPAPVVDALAAGAGRLTALGHDVIFATLCLRAMRERPELATAANVEGLAAVVEAINRRGPGGPFPGWDDPAAVEVGPQDGIPDLGDPTVLATATLDAFAAVGPVHPGLDQGVVLHVLTHAHAILELDALGYDAPARRAREAQRVYLKLLRRRPVGGEPIPAHERAGEDMRSAAYWATDREGRIGWLYGHVFKVPLAFLALARHLPPAERAAREDVLSYALSYT